MLSGVSTRYFLAGAAAIAAATVLAYFLWPKGPGSVVSKPEMRPVRTAIVEPRPIDDDRQAVGEIRARQESDLGFRVSGKVVSRAVDVGVTVKAGDLLARLDEQDYQNKLRSAEADVTSAEAVLTEAQANEDRQSQLLAKGVTTRTNYDAALRNRRSAEAQLESAKAALDLARDQLKYAELRADFEGIVTAVGAEPGQVVNTGQMVVRLAKPDGVDAVFNIAESAFRDRKPEDRPQVIVALLSNPSITSEGIVREVSPVADATTRTYQVKVTLTNPPPAMRFGSSVVGRLKAKTAPVVVLPGSALFDKDGKPAVWLFDAKNSEVSLKPVSVSRFEAGRVIIADGLAKGDIVVTAGVNRLRTGQKVRLLDAVQK
ncbi:MAG: efflux RND transporter periplasmic adaptor subunit [Hyphomicrobiaceae bacterium]